MNNKEIKIYHVLGDENYSCWIPNRKIVYNIDEADVVLFEGGEDVDPSFYKTPQSKNPTTYSNKNRDSREIPIYQMALNKGKFILGICRGSQLICSQQDGGMLVQNQPNPSSIHMMHTFDNKEIMVSSSHHQAMYPFNMDKNDYQILGWTDNMLKYHEGGEKEELNPEKECEIVYFPKTRSLGIQSHPEWMTSEKKSTEWMQQLFLSIYNS